MLRHVSRSALFFYVAISIGVDASKSPWLTSNQRNRFNPLARTFSIRGRCLESQTLAQNFQANASKRDKKGDDAGSATETNSTETWWPLWWRRDIKTTGARQPEKPKKKASELDILSRENDDQSESKDEIENQDELVEDNEEIESNTTSTSENSTKAEDASGQPPDEQKNRPAKKPLQTPPHTSQIIVMGGPHGPGGVGMMGGPVPPHIQQQQQQQQMQKLQQQRNVAITAELIVVLLNGIVRFGFLLWASRWYTHREERIHPTQHFSFERLNDYFVRDARALQTSLTEAPLGVPQQRWNWVMGRRSPSKGWQQQQRMSLDQVFRKTVVVIEYGNNDRGSLDLQYLSDVVSFLITQHRSQAFGSVNKVIESPPALEMKGGNSTNSVNMRKKRTPKTMVSKPVELEVVFKIDSPGGSVATFGLAAAQLERLRREEGITTTVCVDKFAASGGYMIASQANLLVAAPFATVGGVGVIMEGLNFHDILRTYGVQPIVLKAGDSKNPITQFGQVTEGDMKKVQENLEKVHGEFQQFTIRGRPRLKAKKDIVCNGSTYMGKEALELHLIDAIMTSDEYLMERMLAGDRVLKVHRSNLSRIAPHLRFPSPMDILPHLKGRVENWLSNPEASSKFVQVGSFVVVFLHMVKNQLDRIAAK